MMYKGYEIRFGEFFPNEFGFQAWKNNILWAFAMKYEGLKRLIDNCL